MANFNLQDYETVAERLVRFWKDHENGAIITKNLTTEEDRKRGQWIVYSEVYFDRNDSRPAGTGLAFETDGGTGANKFAALENAESSSVGRALSNSSYGGDKRVTREEMAKVARGEQKAAAVKVAAKTAPKLEQPKVDLILNVKTLADLSWLYEQYVEEGVSEDYKHVFTEVKQALKAKEGGAA